MKVCCGLVPVCLWRRSRARWKQREMELEAEVQRWKVAAAGALAAGSLAGRTAALVVEDLQKELAVAREAGKRCEEEARAWAMEQLGVFPSTEQLEGDDL